jgi:hypothetical protein
LFCALAMGGPPFRSGDPAGSAASRLRGSGHASQQPHQKEWLERPPRTDRYRQEQDAPSGSGEGADHEEARSARAGSIEAAQ